MNLNDVDAFTLANNDNFALQKQVAEEVANMEFSLRRTLDQGVAPSEFDKLNALYTAVKAANEILPLLQD